jgi:hypothetical protein
MKNIRRGLGLFFVTLFTFVALPVSASAYSPYLELHQPDTYEVQLAQVEPDISLQEFAASVKGDNQTLNEAPVTTTFSTKSAVLSSSESAVAETIIIALWALFMWEVIRVARAFWSLSLSIEQTS